MSCIPCIEYGGRGRCVPLGQALALASGGNCHNSPSGLGGVQLSGLPPATSETHNPTAQSARAHGLGEQASALAPRFRDKPSERAHRGRNPCETRPAALSGKASSLLPERSKTVGRAQKGEKLGGVEK